MQNVYYFAAFSLTARHVRHQYVLSNWLPASTPVSVRPGEGELGPLPPPPVTGEVSLGLLLLVLVLLLLDVFRGRFTVSFHSLPSQSHVGVHRSPASPAGGCLQTHG